MSAADSFDDRRLGIAPSGLQLLEALLLLAQTCPLFLSISKVALSDLSCLDQYDFCEPMMPPAFIRAVIFFRMPPFGNSRCALLGPQSDSGPLELYQTPLSQQSFSSMMWLRPTMG